MLQKHGKALVIDGAAHFFRTTKDFNAAIGDTEGIATALEVEYPGRTLAVIPVGGRVRTPPGVTLSVYPDYQKFDRALTTRERPVMVPLRRLPFRDFSAEEFVGGHEIHCSRAGGCASVFQRSPVTLGQLADACVYLGAEVGVQNGPGG